MRTIVLGFQGVDGFQFHARFEDERMKTLFAGFEHGAQVRAHPDVISSYLGAVYEEEQ